MSETAWKDVSGEIAAQRRRCLELKSYAERVIAYVAQE
jgi:hypothetical protein